MRENIKKLSVFFLALLLIVGMIPGSVMAISTPTASYCTHVQNEGWQNYVSNGMMSGTEGKSYRLEGIKIKLDTQGYDLGVTYQTHIQNIGWEADTSRDWKSNDTMSGTESLSYRLEAIQIKLTGADADEFDIYYQVHAQNIGWMGWAKNGESAGTAGYSYRLEGIRIKIVPVGLAAPGSTEKAFQDADYYATGKDIVLDNFTYQADGVTNGFGDAKGIVKTIESGAFHADELIGLKVSQNDFTDIDFVWIERFTEPVTYRATFSTGGVTCTERGEFDYTGDDYVFVRKMRGNWKPSEGLVVEGLDVKLSMRYSTGEVKIKEVHLTPKDIFYMYHTSPSL